MRHLRGGGGRGKSRVEVAILDLRIHLRCKLSSRRLDFPSRAVDGPRCEVTAVPRRINAAGYNIDHGLSCGKWKRESCLLSTIFRWPLASVTKSAHIRSSSVSSQLSPRLLKGHDQR